MFDLYISRAGVVTLRDGEIDWFKIGGNWYCDGVIISDAKTIKALDDQLAIYGKLIKF